MMTDDILDRLRAATEGTTPGPWHILSPSVFQFIADARTLIPEAAATIEALRAEVKALRGVVDAATGCANWCDALIEAVNDASVEPEDPEAFGEVVMGAQMFLAAYHKALAALPPDA